MAITLLGTTFGGMAVTFDSGAKAVIMPWQHLQQSPSERVAKEENAEGDRIKGQRSSFSAYLMTHNTQVSILAMALGMTWGVGTIILLFGNGVLLGAVAMDYLLSGEGVFLAGWLLPHGSVEIPSILLAGQAGLVLAGALIGWGAAHYPAGQDAGHIRRCGDFDFRGGLVVDLGRPGGIVFVPVSRTCFALLD